MNNGVFVTGTDTGVGKTYVAAGIAKALYYRGINTGVMKPAETGCRRHAERLVPRDARMLMNAAKVNDPLSLVNPYRFSKPLAPSIAAETEGKSIEINKIIDAYLKLAARHDFMIVEGAGGIMVPLMGSFTYLDLAKLLRLPVLVVARPGLGTINHTLLTVGALKERTITIAGIVINDADNRGPGLAERTSPAVIEVMSGVRILGNVTFGSKEFTKIAGSLL